MTAFTIDGKIYSKKWISDIKFSDYSRGEKAVITSIDIDDGKYSGSFAVKRLVRTASNSVFKNAVVVASCYDPNNEIYNRFFGFEELQNDVPNFTVFVYN